VAVREGVLSTGAVYMSETVQKANVGAGIALQNPKNQPSAIFNNNVASWNRAGWYDTRLGGTRQRNFNIAVCATCAVTDNTTIYQNPLTDDEDAARVAFARKLAAAGIILGPRP
jgi:hypothetical protein